jgi:hypothetical protein
METKAEEEEIAATEIDEACCLCRVGSTADRVVPFLDELRIRADVPGRHHAPLEGVTDAMA